MTCIDHLEFTGKTCPDCGCLVDDYGNTEDQFDYCSFPDCGCDGARLCMAPNGASELADGINVEGMYQRKDKKAKVARMALLGLALERERKDQ